MSRSLCSWGIGALPISIYRSCSAYLPISSPVSRNRTARPAGTKANPVALNCSIARNILPGNVKPSTRTIVPPASMAQRSLPKPKEWLRGRGTISTSSSPFPMKVLIFRAADRILPWVRTTPFGFPVVPVVKRTSETSRGSGTPTSMSPYSRESNSLILLTENPPSLYSFTVKTPFGSTCSMMNRSRDAGVSGSMEIATAPMACVPKYP